MSNPGMVLLVSFVIMLAVAVISLLSWAAIESYRPGSRVIPPCNEDTNIASLVQISNDSKCIQNGIATSLYYIGDIKGSNYNYVVAPWKTQPLDVCAGFCTKYSEGVCSGAVSNGKSAQDNFNHCMSQLSGQDCSPPIPIAADGTIIYYAYSPTCNVCDNCGQRYPSS